MKMSLVRAGVVSLAGLLIAGTALVADGTRFSDYTPLTSSAGPTLNEAAPITFGNPLFQQESIADRTFQLGSGAPNAGAWDMNAVNETGPHKGRYLFTPFETGAGGIQRTDLSTGVTETIWQSWAGYPATRMDPSYWTPWGTLHHRRGKLGRLRTPPLTPADACSSSGTRSRRRRSSRRSARPAMTARTSSTRTSFRACRTKGFSSTRPATCTSSTS